MLHKIKATEWHSVFYAHLFLPGRKNRQDLGSDLKSIQPYKTDFPEDTKQNSTTHNWVTGVITPKQLPTLWGATCRWLIH